MKIIPAIVFAACLLAPGATRPCLRNAGIFPADTVFTDTLNLDEPGYLLFAEQMPSFEGGDLVAFLKWVTTQVEYPAELLAEGVEGTITVSFVVDKDGSVVHVKALASPDPRLTAAVIAAVERSPRWEPGRNGGEAVAVYRTIPVKFALPKVPGEDKSDNTPSEVDVMPKFMVGGMEKFREWMYTKIEYPSSAKNKKIEGKVVISFVVESDGSVGEIEILQSPAPILANEVLRVLRKSPKWTPGTKNGEPVRVQFIIPLEFSMSKDSEEDENNYMLEKYGVKKEPDAGLVVPQFMDGGTEKFGKWIESKIAYPSKAVTKGTQGRVLISFIVEKDGSVGEVKILQSPSAALTNETLRIIRSCPNWTPGTKNGEPVRVQFTLPVNFRIQW